MRARKLIVVAVLCLLLGVAANLGVVWGIVLLINRDKFRVMNEAREWRETAWPDAPPGDWGEVQSWSGLESRGWRIVSAFGDKRSMTVDDVGWPMRSMRRELCLEDGKPLDRGIWWSGVKLAGLREPFPLRPLWPGFAANMGVFALAIGAGFYGIGKAIEERGRRRRRVGQCAGCGYELAGALACPECGRAVTEAGR